MTTHLCAHNVMLFKSAIEYRGVASFQQTAGLLGLLITSHRTSGHRHQPTTTSYDFLSLHSNPLGVAMSRHKWSQATAAAAAAAAAAATLRSRHRETSQRQRWPLSILLVIFYPLLPLCNLLFRVISLPVSVLLQRVRKLQPGLYPTLPSFCSICERTLSREAISACLCLPVCLCLQVLK